MPSDKAMKAAREWLALNPVSPLCMTKADVDKLAALLDEFAAQEREACAKVADDQLLFVRIVSSGESRHTYAEGRISNIAAAIRARGEGK